MLYKASILINSVFLNCSLFPQMMLQSFGVLKTTVVSLKEYLKKIPPIKVLFIKKGLKAFVSNGKNPDYNSVEIFFTYMD